MNVSEPQLAPVRTLRPVFVLAATVVCTFALLVALFPLDAGRILLDAQTWASRNVGWYYLLAMTLYLVFVLGVALSSYGNIKLGADHDEPEFSYLSWAGMLFAAGISITLFFFCVSEPLTHYLQPPQGGTGNGEASARQAMQLLFLHWGLHGWGVFALAAMALAYFAFRHNLPLALRSGLYPLIGKRINGPIGYTVDALGIVATVFGLGADMGFGVLHLNAGLATLFNVPHTHWVQVALIVAMMGAAILVAVSGVEKGVRWMSDINMLLAIALLLFMLFAGPTQYLLNALMQNLGDYLGSVVGKSFDVYAYGGRPDWLGNWTVFYWAWWIGWAPFVGLFIARISRGRTIREFVLGVLLIPLGFTLAWLSIFGNSALDQLLHHGQAAWAQQAIDAPQTVLYSLLQDYPWSRVVITITVAISFVFFVTSADSGTVVLSTLSSHGGEPHDDGPRWLRVFWGVLTAVVTAGLLLAGSMDALKSAVVLASLPFSAVLLLMAWGLSRALSEESQRKRAQLYNPSPLIGQSRDHRGWRQRLGQAMHFAARDEVYRFMHEQVRPAIEAVAAQLQDEGWQVSSRLDDADMEISVDHGEQQGFRYQVVMRGYLTPSFAAQRLRNQRYYRAEVYLFEGSQDYDLVGYSREQIINDIIDQYERHLQFLHLTR
ncbi:choline BCCT transporter BetT [Xanthomonas campestris]|uniref:choline BCCT transporter BetT n=1 Tax=Xanthomonas campestris TaxID=339 RepID=UPI00236536F1|nr:choline BCCT transporter BetT [Xanthomonas campestris]MEA0761200.1 choline BCCT transporter BetT [Xanthomonas campestris pv. campestris]MEB1222903.1 choline BCCT transporter BetT [Xanthomonas campestris pv. campestris]MEB1243481.1 choline BCCT transporter BetT [Xanthomonas campestris pv. campestris]MEB1251972.1 choline BCCT transporter BetT [Xanthomonas campestris pv. campestris]MEB1293366.1 choline BCCT transporter BetT [Xanthomonas campestris pv. campestris]